MDDEALPAVEEALLFSAFAATIRGGSAAWSDLQRNLDDLEDPRIDSERAVAHADILVARGWLTKEGERFLPTAAGLAVLGYSSATGAAKEGAEHRALLLAAFRLFAQHDCRLRILRQGRFDRRTPDAEFCQLAERLDGRDPRALAATLDRTRRSWAWRFFSGRNVHVEAEVSGADRPERIRVGLAKARERRAFALFVVGSARRARRIRYMLHERGLVPREAQVWTLDCSRVSVLGKTAQADAELKPD